jgi:hypothetical protein
MPSVAVVVQHSLETMVAQVAVEAYQVKVKVKAVKVITAASVMETATVAVVVQVVSAATVQETRVATAVRRQRTTGQELPTLLLAAAAVQVQPQVALVARTQATVKAVQEQPQLLAQQTTLVAAAVNTVQVR